MSTVFCIQVIIDRYVKVVLRCIWYKSSSQPNNCFNTKLNHTILVCFMTLFMRIRILFLDVHKKNKYELTLK